MHGGTIYRARKRYVWPGEAAVVVSIVHVVKGAFERPFLLNGKWVDRITAFLFHAGGHADPQGLDENAGKSFSGNYVLGTGFTFDDAEHDGHATTIAEMQRLIEADPRNSERIFPYIGGEEILSDPRQLHSRFVIDFEEFPLKRVSEGASWNDISESVRREQLRSGIVAWGLPPSQKALRP